MDLGETSVIFFTFIYYFNEVRLFRLFRVVADLVALGFHVYFSLRLFVHVLCTTLP